MKIFNISILLLISTITLFGMDEKSKATIYKTDATVIQADEILANFGKKWNVSLIIGDERIKSNLEINRIKRLEIDEWDSGDDKWWIKGKVILRQNNSTDLQEEYIILADPDSIFKRDDQYVVYKKYDPINRELIKNRVWSQNIKAIEFGKSVGSYKVDSRGNKFNPDYIYSPYTGEEMDFGN